MIIEFFLGFVGIVFAIAGAALVKFTSGAKPSTGQNVNVQEVVGFADAAKSKLNYLTRLYNPEKFDQYLENTLNYMKDKVDKMKVVSQYLMQKEKQIAAELQRKVVENAGKYLQPLRELRGKLEAPLKGLGLLYQINELENAGYIGKKELQKAGSEALYLSNAEQAVNSRFQNLYNFLTKAKSGFFRKK
jgi:hypothetical protein